MARGRSNWPSGFALADIAAVIELAVDGVNMAIEDQDAGMQRAGAFGNGGYVRSLGSKQRSGG